MTSPPSFWRNLLSRVVPAEDRQVLLDEMDRLYRGRVQSLGDRDADRWYRREVTHFVRRWPWEWTTSTLRHIGVELGGLGRLTRQTIRSLRRAPGFAPVAIITLALGIGCTAVIVGIVDRALLRPLPYPEPDQLVAVLDGWSTSLGSIEVLQNEMETVDVLGGATNAVGMTLEAGSAPARRVTVAAVSPEYLDALRVAPVLGRTFVSAEAQPGQGNVVLLGYDFWQSHYGGSASALNRTLLLDGESYAVVGVLPVGFDMPSSRNDLWRPAVMDASNAGLHWGAGNYTVLARLAPGATLERVRQELVQVQAQVREANPLWTPAPDAWDEAQATTLQESRSNGVRTPLLVLLGAVGMVLLVVCANVASLFVSRARAQSRENAVKSALGAATGRLAREQLFEVVLITLVGLLMGLGVAALGIEALKPLLPAELPGAQQSGLDARVIGITAGIALLTAVAAGLLPAWRSARMAPAAFLYEAGRGSTASYSRRRVTRWLVGAQLCAAVVLVTSAGLLARTLFELNRIDPGFEIDTRATAELHLPPGLPEDPEARAAYFKQLETELETHGALTQVAFASTIPFGSEDEFVAFGIDGVTTDPNDLPVLAHHRVSPGFFEVAGIPLLRGRPFSDTDQPNTPHVVIVDQGFVDQFFDGADPIGRITRYPWRGAPPMEIVGVVGQTAHGDLSEDLAPTIWVPLAQMGLGTLGNATVVARARADVDAALGGITQRLRDFDSRIAVSDMASYRRLVDESMASTRLLTLLLLVFATTTLLLGCIGVYGVAAFSVRERFKEFGVRMALGASTGGIRRDVLRDGLVLAVPGCILGLLLAIPAARAMRGVLFGIAPIDPLAFGIAPLVLGCSAILAVYVPARRATQVDPATVLRDE